MSVLSWISVGPVSAERDADLQRYFYDAGASAQLVNDPTRFLMLGRKGAGKTAVFLHMKARPPGLFRHGDLVIPLSTTEYNWRAHAALADINKTGGAQFRDSWRFLISVESIRALSQHYCVLAQECPKPIAKAQRMLDRLFGSPIPEWSELLRKKLFSLSKFKLPSAGLDEDGPSIDAGEVSFSQLEADESLRSTLAFNIDHFTTYLEDAVRQGLNGCRIFVIFDKVDENWLTDSLDTCKQMIGGLIQAAEYFTQKYEGKWRPIVFLREDIFDSLNTINDKNKLKMDCSKTLMWNEDSLEKLALCRINYFARAAGQSTIKSLDELFDKNTVRSRSTPAKYIFQRTFSRPRDIVAFLTKVVQVGHETLHDGEIAEDSNGKLLTGLIYDAEAAFSEYMYDELIDEWRTQHPAIVGYLQILTNIKYTTFSPAKFEAEFKNVFRQGVQSDTVRKVLVFLFQVSVIGYKLGDSGKRCFRCFYSSRRFEDSNEYLVHFGLVKQLGLTEGRAPEPKAVDHKGDLNYSESEG